MKTIQTKLTETRFSERLKTTVCVPYEDYKTVLENTTGFVVKQKRNRFSIGQRVEMPRGYGFYAEWLCGVYSTNDCGTVDVQYRFRKPFLYMFPFLVCLVFGIPILIGTLYSGVIDGIWQWGGILVAVIFTTFGVIGLSMKSHSNRQALEKRLKKICCSSET